MGQCFITRIASSGDDKLKDMIDGTIENIKNIDGITKIKSHAFYNTRPNHGLNSIVLPDTLTDIGDWAFYGNTNLSGLVIPDAVVHIGERAFEGCENLYEDTFYIGKWFVGCNRVISDIYTIKDGTVGFADEALRGRHSLRQIILPDTLEYLGEGTFYQCDSLETINLPDSIKYLEDRLFNKCGKLNNISLPSNLHWIGTGAFSECTSLTNLIIPNTVKAISHYAFEGCSALSNIILGTGIDTIWSNCFENCTSLKSISLPNTIKYLFSSCFYGSGLENITLPQTVTQIEYRAFANCLSLTTMTILATVPPTLSTSDAISSATTTIRVPTGSLSAYQTAENWSNFADLMVGI